MTAGAERPEASVGRLLAEKGLTLSVAESCTGGMIAAMITSVPGSSRYFAGGVVAYENRVKTALLGVKPATLESCGAVSEKTAREMARGVRKALSTGAGVSTTGIAGPGGGTPEKPVGLVWIAVSVKNRVSSVKRVFRGNRNSIRKQASIEALKELTRLLKEL